MKHIELVYSDSGTVQVSRLFQPE